MLKFLLCGALTRDEIVIAPSNRTFLMLLPHCPTECTRRISRDWATVIEMAEYYWSGALFCQAMLSQSPIST